MLLICTYLICFDFKRYWYKGIHFWLIFYNENMMRTWKKLIFCFGRFFKNERAISKRRNSMCTTQRSVKGKFPFRIRNYRFAIFTGFAIFLISSFSMISVQKKKKLVSVRIINYRSTIHPICILTSFQFQSYIHWTISSFHYYLGIRVPEQIAIIFSLSP